MTVPQPSMIDALARLGDMPESLRAIAHPARLREAIERNVHEFSSGALTLEHVEPRRLRLKDGRCTGNYELTVGETRSRRRILRLRGEADPLRHGSGELRPGWRGRLGEQGWRCNIPELGLVLETPPPDPTLLAMPLLTDPARAGELLEDAIRQASPSYREARIQSCVPNVVRYKRGKRCTIVYELDFGADAQDRGWPARVVAKTYRGNKGRSAFAGMRALWDSNLRRSEHVGIAEPLAFLDDLNVLIQGPVPGDIALKRLLKSALGTDTADVEGLGRVVTKTARGLAALHGSGARGPLVTWEHRFAKVRDRIARLARWVAGLDRALIPSLSRLEALCTELPPQDPVASHGSFGPHQVLVHGEDIAFIDFDKFCDAEPAMDVARFRAKVMAVGMRVGAREHEESSPSQLAERYAGPDRLCELFLGAYREAAPISQERLALWETLYFLTEVWNTWKEIRPERLAGSMMLLDRHLRRARLAGV